MRTYLIVLLVYIAASIGIMGVWSFASEHFQRRSVLKDPRLVVKRADGSIILDTRLLEWIGRAIILHHLPQDLDDAQVYLDGKRVVAP